MQQRNQCKAVSVKADITKIFDFILFRPLIKIHITGSFFVIIKWIQKILPHFPVTRYEVSEHSKPPLGLAQYFLLCHKI